jgi:hypothetical protein
MKNTTRLVASWNFFAIVVVLLGWWLAHLYVFCKGGNGEGGTHSFSL